jgi:hypothetical protein
MKEGDDMPSSKIYFGSPTIPPASDKLVIEVITLDANMISEQKLTLSDTPVNISQISAWVINGSTFTPGIDFTLSGKIIDFSISSYAGVLAVGNAIQFIYKKV